MQVCYSSRQNFRLQPFRGIQEVKESRYLGITLDKCLHLTTEADRHLKSLDYWRNRMCRQKQTLTGSRYIIFKSLLESKSHNSLLVIFRYSENAREKVLTFYYRSIKALLCINTNPSKSDLLTQAIPNLSQ